MTPAELKAWRASAGLSQPQLAQLLGVDVMTVSRWERGHCPTQAYLKLALQQLQVRDYVPCAGCGLRNYETTNPVWNCPDFPRCAEGAF